MHPRIISVFVTAAFLSALPSPGAVLVWTNLNGGNWSAAGNWQPNQVPGWGDTVVITNAGVYSVTNDHLATVGSLILGSRTSGAQTLFVPTEGSVSLSGSSIVNSNSAGGGGVMLLAGSLSLYKPLTNAGTIRMTNQFTLLVNDGSATQSGGLLNLGTLDLQGSARIHGGAGGVHSYVTNLGLIVRSAGPGTSSITVGRFETSAGTVSAQTGTLSVGNFVGTLAGTFTTSPGATTALNGGTDLAQPVIAGSPLVLGGAGQYRFTGGYLHLPVDVIPNLVLGGGTTTLGPGFQGGTIVKLEVAGTKLLGTNVITGSLIASNGSMLAGTFTVAGGGVLTANNALCVGLNLDSRILIQNGGVLQVGPMGGAVNASGSAGISQALEVAAGGLLNVGASFIVHGPFTNAGVINLTNSPLVLANDGTPAHEGGLVNLAGGALNFRGSGRVAGSSLSPNREYLVNQGDIVKLSSGGTNSLNVASLINQGAITAQHGTLEITQVTLEPAGSLNVLVSGPADAGRVSFPNPVILAGSLGVSLKPGYVPDLNSWVTLLNYPSRSGQFDRTNLPSGLSWETWYDTGALKVRSIDLPSSTRVARWIGVSDGNWSDPANWDIGRVPNNTSTELFDIIWDAHPVTITLDQAVTIHAFTNFTAGTLRLNGGSIATSGDGVIAFTAGRLLGQGELGRAILGGGAGPGPVLEGQICFTDLWLGPDAKVRVTLGGRTPGSFDHFTISNSIKFNGTLEVGFGGGFETNVLSADAFEIITFGLMTSVIGDFGNVRFYHRYASEDPRPRLTTSDGRGSFVVELVRPGASDRWVFLRDLLLPTVTARWTNGLAGDWHDPENWDIHRVPNNDGISFYHVVWDAHPVTITVDRPVTIENLTFRTPGTLSGPADLRIVKNLIWENGTMSGSGTTAVLGAAHLLPSPSSALRLDNRTLSLSGPSRCKGHLWLQNDAQLINEASGYLVIDAPAALQSSTPIDSPPRYQIRNFGHVEDVSFSTDQVTIDAGFSNGGRVTAHEKVVWTRDFRQEAGETIIHKDASIGRLSLVGGELEGNGFVRSASIAGKLRPIRTLTFDNLVFSSTATLSIPELVPVASQPFITVRDGADLGGCTLELNTWRDQELDYRTVYRLIESSSGTPVINTFGNVPFGGRLSTVQNHSSYIVDQEGAEVVLKDLITEVHIPSVDGAVCVAVLLRFLQDLSTDTPVSKHDLAPKISLASLYALQALMKQSRSGRELVDLYWEHTPEVVAILRTNPPLASAAIKLFTDFQPAIRALLSGNGQAVPLTPTLLEDVNSAWNSLTNYASPRLRWALEGQRVRFNGFLDFAGKDFAQWAGLLQIPAPTQPWIFLRNPTLLGAPKQTNRIFTVQANEILGRTIGLWRSLDFSSWEPVPTQSSSPNNATVELSDTNAPPGSFFYRAGVQP